jgi:acyl-CoA synthetase (AMP-forming)/AMP-acid ligase II
MLSEEAQIVTPYGATESLPICSIGSRELLDGDEIRIRTEAGDGVCVGRPVEGVRLQIVSIDDGPIAREVDLEPLGMGMVGEVVVCSEMTSDTYFNRPRSTELAKVATESGRPAHRMGDLGFFDDQGRLWFCGRKSQRVMTAEGVLFTVPCELVFQNHPAVNRSALVKVLSGESCLPVICIELEPGVRIPREKLEHELRDLALSRPHTKSIETFLVHPSFPVDIRHNAKIRRGELAKWAQSRLVGRNERATVS